MQQLYLENLNYWTMYQISYRYFKENIRRMQTGTVCIPKVTLFSRKITVNIFLWSYLWSVFKTSTALLLFLYLKCFSHFCRLHSFNSKIFSVKEVQFYQFAFKFFNDKKKQKTKNATLLETYNLKINLSLKS